MTALSGSIQILSKTDAELIALGSPFIPLAGQPIKISDTGLFCIGDGVTAYTSLVKINFSTLLSHLSNTSNPHSVTKTQVGLSNADNTSDVNKPVSSAQQTAIDAKVRDQITNGVTSSAPSENAVFDALALKQAAGESAGGDLTGTYPNPTLIPNAASYLKSYNGIQLSIVNSLRNMYNF